MNYYRINLVYYQNVSSYVLSFTGIMISEDFNKIVCQRIYSLRKESGLTIEQLAYQNGISKERLSKIEHNKKSQEHILF